MSDAVDENKKAKYDQAIDNAKLSELNAKIEGLQAAARFWQDRAGQFSVELEQLRNQEPVAIVNNGNVHWIVDNWPDNTKLYLAAPVKPDQCLVANEKDIRTHAVGCPCPLCMNAGQRKVR